jgi:hypothetical protein
MDNWRNVILISDAQKQEMAREAEQARQLREINGSPRKTGWPIRFVALTIILLGMIAVWLH